MKSKERKGLKMHITKHILSFIVAAGLMGNVLQLFSVDAHDEEDVSKVICTDKAVYLGTQQTELKYSNSNGYYIERNVDQGVEITILGYGDYKLAYNPADHGYYLFATEDITSIDIANANLTELPIGNSRDGSFENPTTVVHKQVGNLTIYGVWWGGLLQNTGIVDSVASVVIATSFNSQGRASVYTGYGGSWHYSDWENKDVRADVIAGTGITGNLAKWDLRAL